MNFNELYKKIAELDEAFRPKRNRDEDEEDFGHEADDEYERRKDDARDRAREEKAEKSKSYEKTSEAKWDNDLGDENDDSAPRDSYNDNESSGSKNLSKDELAELFAKFQDGEITYDELRQTLDAHKYDPRSKSNADDDYTDYSMRQGEMGNPDARRTEEYSTGKGDIMNADVNSSQDDYTMESIRRATQASSLLKECGANMMPQAGAAKSVTMNVTMNASSGEGIRELLGVLSNFESTSSDGPAPMEMPMVMNPTSGHSLDKGPVGADDSMGDTMDDSGESDMGDFEEDYANSPDEDYGTVGDVINPPSDDLNSPHQSYKNNPLGGDNKMAENIAQRLLAQYKLSAKLSENAETEPVLDAKYSISTRDDGKFDVNCTVKQKNKVRGDTYWKTPKHTPVKTFKTREEAKAHGERWVAKYKK